MDPILIFVVLPLATIIFSIALQRLFKCPVLVAAIIFAIFLILTYTVFGTDFIIFAILFAVLAFITAFLSNLFCKLIRRLRNLERRNTDCDCDDDDNETNEKLLTISSRCGNGESAELLTISTGGTCGNNNSNNNCGCTNYSNNCNWGDNNNSNSERIVLNAEVLPSNNGRSGAFRGCFRRRCN